MSKYWKLNTRGDPLGAVTTFMEAIWQTAGLSGMLVLPNGKGTDISQKAPFFANEMSELEYTNPFMPLMTINAAKLIPELVRTHAGKRIGAVLRPCEQRALQQMEKRASFDTSGLLTISFDCLGTFPDHEYEWRARRKGSTGQLAQENVQFARQGGINAYRYRPACQMCVMPVAQGADINIGVIGLPIRQYILVSTPDAQLAIELDFDRITDGVADEETASEYVRMAAKIAARRQSMRERVSETLRENFPDDVDSLIHMLEECVDCRDCMDACPICSVEAPHKTAEGKLVREEVIHWLLACSGCGMCEQSCGNQLPLAAIFTAIHEQLVSANL